MNREIKFKFVIRTGDEISVTEAYHLGDLMDYVNVLCEYSADEILHELQFTGRLDKNDVEIYEGDNCKLTSSNEQNIEAHVVYEGNCFTFKNDVMTDYTMHNDTFSQYTKTIEIIGNIHESEGDINV